MRKKILIILAVFLAAAAAVIFIRRDTRPNIVLIIIDTLRADKLETYGFPGKVAPELDELAREGAVFMNTLAQSSWTRSSTGSFLTSLHPRTIGIYKETWDILQDKFTTLAEALQDESYHTIGLTANPQLNPVFNFHQGFDTYVESNVIFPTMKPEEGKQRMSKKTPLPRAPEIYGRALEEVKKAGKKPVYLQINIMEVHTSGYKRIKKKQISQDLRQYQSPKYLQAVRNASRETGLFLKQLLALPGWENTLVVVLSDHGEGLRDHPNVARSERHGCLLYESQVKVPLILFNRRDEALKGKRIEQTARLLDVMPTILDYAGVTGPEDMQGISLLKLIDNPSADVGLPETNISETNFRKAEKIAVYGKDWKYIENRDKWKGVNPRELQARGGFENGKRTDKIDQHRAAAEELAAVMSEWEDEHTKAAPMNPGQAPSSEEVQQLKSLGYLK